MFYAIRQVIEFLAWLAVGVILLIFMCVILGTVALVAG